MAMPPPRPVLPTAHDRPLRDSAGSRALECAAAVSLPPHALMARAGLASARLARALAPHARTIDICCGPGNNGGDGLIAAVHLHQVGLAVRAVLLGDPQKLPVDATDALRQARAGGVRIDTVLPASLDGDLLIDALLGQGANRPVEGTLMQAIERINAAKRPVLAIDLPTGLHGDTGATLGGAVVRADHTLALLSLKPGLFTGHGRECAGRIWFDGLGVESDAVAACALLAGAPQARTARGWRGHTQHKGSFGNVLVIGGVAGMAGAAVLAARAALAAGGGRVYLAGSGLPHDGFDPSRPELMLRPVPALLAPPMLASGTTVCGCGGGAAIRDWLPPVIHHAARLVLDADALNAVAAEPALRLAVRARASRGLPTIVTPHPLEAARLLGSDAAAVQIDRLRAAQTLADDLAACVVLKGSGSVVATPDALPRINPTGNARLATAGTGDVLAGWLGGLWAQHGEDRSIQDIAAAAVWLHGQAASLSPGRGPLLAADLIGAIGDAADALFTAG